MSFTNDLKIQLKGTYRSVILLMIINISIFLVVNIFSNLVKLSGENSSSREVMDFICLNSDLSHFITRFWTVGSYMFVHFGLMHLLSNMLWLWFLGRMFCEYLGGKRMMNVYLLGGLSGGILFIVVSAILPELKNAYLMGASGAVMAVVVALAAYTPESKVFPFGIAMKLKWLALISFALTTLIDLSDNTGGKAAHIGGAIFGLLYGFNLKNGNILSGIFKKRSKLKVAHSRKVTDQEYNVKKTSVRKRVDEILDKISRSGYDSLSREEKDFLQKNHDKL